MDGSPASTDWKWRKAREYCTNIIPTLFNGGSSDLYSVNSIDKHHAISKLALENNIKVKAGFIGLADKDDDGTWLWLDGEPTNGFYVWRSGLNPPTGTNKKVAVIRFNTFGFGWDPYSKGAKGQVIICSHR